jgi:hypothetical protein
MRRRGPCVWKMQSPHLDSWGVYRRVVSTKIRTLCLRARAVDSSTSSKPLQSPAAVLHAPLGACRAAAYHFSRPASHVCVAPIPEEHPPKVSAGTPGTRLCHHHPRHLQPHVVRHGWRGRQRDGGGALPGCIDGHANRNIERSKIRIADVWSIGSRSFRYAWIVARISRCSP